MAVVCDFTLIRGDNSVRIGDGNINWSTNFGTGGRHASDALLMFNIKGLTHATQLAEVNINGIEVGRIYPYSLVNGSPNPNISEHWFTQMIAVSGSTLQKSGTNQLSISAVGYPNNPNDDNFDDFYLKNVVCFFHQEA